MSSRSDSDSESNRSASPAHQGPAPTPGHGLDRSASNSPQYPRSSREASPERAESRTSRSRSGSPASSARSRSRSGSAGSNKSSASRKSRSRSVASNRSAGSASPKSQRSGSNRSPTPAGSQKSRSSSAGSRKSGGSRSRSSSRGSKKSRSRSGSASSKKTRSRSGSAASRKSRSRSRSGSAGSNKSGSRRSSGSRSASAASNRSKSAESNRSRQSRSRTPSPEKGAGSQANSRSASPNLQIDEPGSPDSAKGDKRKRDSSEEPVTKKKNRVITSDSEGEAEGGKEEDKEVSAGDIFGDADDISSEEEKDKAGSDREARRSDDEDDEERHRRSDEEREPRQAEDEEDKDNEPEPIPETRIDVEIPKISCDLGRDIHFVKLPNFLSVETRPFDPETYEDEIDEEETLDEEGRARLKLKVENTIRWKEIMDKDGNTKKESNARLVRWSDGSYSLHLGSEIFDVYKQPLQGDHNHLFIRQGTGLQGQAVFRTKLSFRPHSTESFTHRKMTLSLADRSQKTSGIKILSQVGADPDHDRKNLLKKEEEKLRQTVRQSKPRTRKGDGGSRTHNTSVYREEEGSDEEGAISLNAIKNKYKSGAGNTAKGGAIYSSDEEGSDIEARRARKLDKAKVLKDSESSEESE